MNLSSIFTNPDIYKKLDEEVVLDLSPESVDALASELEQNPIKNNRKRAKADAGDSRADSSGSFRRKPALPGSHRLKRSRVSKEEIVKQITEGPPPKKDPWRIQKDALEEKFPGG